jgi:uncharacterized protein
MEPSPPAVLADPKKPGNTGAVPERERIESIDVLRGVAVLGILVMNIQSFSMVDIAYIIPTAYGDLTGWNYLVWYLSYLLADQKFITIFSMLFGAGIVLMTRRQEAATGRSGAVHYRRMAILLLFGALHAYLIWYGDILVTYALCGMLVYWFRRCRVGVQILLGVLLLVVGCLISVGLYYWVISNPEMAGEFQKGLNPSAAELQREIDAYRGNWLSCLEHRVPVTIQFETAIFLYFTFWKAAGLMLIGMGLFKLGVFSAQASRATYLAFIALGVLVGIPVIAFGERQAAARNWDAIYWFLAGSEYNYWGSVLVALAYVGLVMLVCQQASWKRFTLPLAAAGRMALTNYLLQSIICTTLFYGYGFGLFGKVARVGQIGIVFAIWVFQLVICPLWLRFFPYGPAEWLWRLLTYGRWPSRGLT